LLVRDQFFQSDNFTEFIVTVFIIRFGPGLYHARSKHDEHRVRDEVDGRGDEKDQPPLTYSLLNQSNAFN